MCRFFKDVTCKQAINLFGIMEIYETIYEGIVEPYLKQSTGSEATCDGQSINMRVRYFLSNSNSYISGLTINHKKFHADFFSVESQLTCLIGDSVHSSYQCKFLSGFCERNSSGRPNKESIN